MAHLPRFEQRPTHSYYLGHIMGQGCLTSSLFVNLIRLLAFSALLVTCGILIGGSDTGLAAGVSLMLLLASFAYRPREILRSAPPAEWTPKEQRLARLIRVAEVEGRAITGAMAEAGLTGQFAVDYGITAGDERPICVSQRLRRAHQLTTGGSGSGKSKFIATQAAQGAVLGSSIAVIDPHEELAQDILCSAAHILAERGCIIIWPGGPTRRIYPWNPLRTGPGREPWQAADLVIGAVKRVWGLDDRNTYIIDVLRHTAWALAAAGWTLLEGPRFLVDGTFRAYITERAGIPQVQEWVTIYDEMAPKERQALIQTTLVRLNRLHANPHLRRLFGCGVTDPAYLAAMRRQGIDVAGGEDLVGAINRGHHLFAVIPVRALGEDQYLVAGFIQSALISAALSRRPNDPEVPELEMYLDEAAAYANAEGLGKLLAQARKYKASAMVAMQGLHQAEQALAQELQTNTAIKTIFGTDNPLEAETAAEMLFSYEPLAIKVDSRRRSDTEGGAKRESGMLVHYTPYEQVAFTAGQLVRLQPRHYYLRIRGEERTPLLAVTPDYIARYHFTDALQVAGKRKVGRLCGEEQIDRELEARYCWLEARSYGLKEYAVPTLGGEAGVPESVHHKVCLATKHGR